MPWDFGCERRVLDGRPAFSYAGDIARSNIHCEKEFARTAIGCTQLVLVST
jgi:hypothetical protein